MTKARGCVLVRHLYTHRGVRLVRFFGAMRRGQRLVHRPRGRIVRRWLDVPVDRVRSERVFGVPQRRRLPVERVRHP